MVDSIDIYFVFYSRCFFELCGEKWTSILSCHFCPANSSTSRLRDRHTGTSSMNSADTEVKEGSLHSNYCGGLGESRGRVLPSDFYWWGISLKCLRGSRRSSRRLIWAKRVSCGYVFFTLKIKLKYKESVVITKLSHLYKVDVLPDFEKTRLDLWIYGVYCTKIYFQKGVIVDPRNVWLQTVYQTYIFTCDGKCK